MTQVLCPIVVGREQELRVLREGVRAAREGTGGTVFLVGEAGIGKSRLTREAGAIARETGMRTLRGRAVQAATPLAYRPLAEALHEAVRAEGPPDTPDLQPYRRALGQLVPQWTDDRDERSEEASPLLVIEGTLHLLRSLAVDDGLLLVLEDLHWADPETLETVEYLSDHLASERVLCLCTARSDEPGPGTALAEALSARRTAERIVLSRLSDEGSDDMVRASLSDRPTDEILAAVRVRAEGVPFLVEELLTAYATAAPETDQTQWLRTLPSSYRALVRQRLSSVSPQTRKVVFAAAVLGRNFEWSLLGSIAGVDEGTVLAALREAAQWQLIEAAGAGAQVGFGFRHALVREAVLAELLAPERAALSLRAAHVIEERFPALPGEWCERVADLREEGGDRHGAAKLLLETGRRALARAALATAEATLERGRALATGDQWLRWGIGQVLLEALALSGKVDRVRALGNELVPFFERNVVKGFWPHLIAPVHLRIARGIAAAGDWALARAHLEQARAAARPGDDALLARITSFEARAALEEDETDDAARLADASLADAERLSLHDVACESLEILGRAAFRRGDIAEARRTLESAAGVAAKHELHLCQARALLALGTIDRCTTAQPHNLLEARRLARATDAVSTQVRIELEVGRSLLERFQRGPALEALDACVSTCRRYRLPLLARALASRAHALALLSEEVKPSLEEALSLAPEDTGLLADASVARGVLALVTGQRRTAIEELESAMDHRRLGGGGDPEPFAGLRALLWIVEGDGSEEARSEAAGSGDGLHAATHGYLALTRSVEAGRRGRTEEAVAAFTSADRALKPFPWHRHVGRLLVLEAGARRGWGEPVEWIRETLVFFETAGHRGLADACKRLLRLAGAPVPRRGRGDSQVPPALRALGVTSREMDVLRLVTESLSNPEIAERLHLSRRTVESHVASLLRRTGATTREELAAIAREAD